MKYKITMGSDIYGTEEFPYATKREADAGWKRLEKSILDNQKKDGVPRTLKMWKRKGEEYHVLIYEEFDCNLEHEILLSNYCRENNFCSRCEQSWDCPDGHGECFDWELINA